MEANRYYIQETNQSAEHRRETENKAGTKARVDASLVFERLGCQPIPIDCFTKSRSSVGKMLDLIKPSRYGKGVKQLKEGDILLFQHPLLLKSFADVRWLKRLERKGVKTICLVHDVWELRDHGDNALINRFLRPFERKLFAHCSCLILHNDSMVNEVSKSLGCLTPSVSLGIFDYFVKEGEKTATGNSKDGPVVIAGNLDPAKTGYIGSLPLDVPFRLFGVGFVDEGKPNLHYEGVFPPDDLPLLLSGSFGLVWDGDSVSTCQGQYGGYLRYNNPHKCSLYLASGLPVIVWRESALASFVEENHCGLLVDSLTDLPGILAKLSEESYQELLNGAVRVSELIKEGHFLSTAIEKAIELCQKQ